MFEHVGQKNYRTFMETAARCLKPDGLFLLHTIGNSVADTAIDPWLNKYIFPNAALPSAVHLTRALQDRFLLQDWHNFGPDYDLTLMSWWGRFQRAWPDLAHHYDQRFYRMWRYYLMSCAAFFRTRRGQLWQLVLSHRDREPVYRSIR